MAAPLHVIAPIFNSAGVASRYRLYRDFEKRMRGANIEFHTIELALGDQPFAVTDPDNSHQVQVRAKDAFWYKENLVNVAVRKLPSDWEYVAWVDADVQFTRPDWPQATIDQLQRHAFVQMFSNIVDLGPNYDPVSVKPGFVYRYPPALGTWMDGKPFPARQFRGLPGGAWAARRQEFEAIGGLVDWTIVGDGDAIFALGVTGRLGLERTAAMGPAYRQSLFDWQAKCELHVKHNVGHVDDVMIHYWHGRRADRGYVVREQILALNAFDPFTDLIRDENGLLHLAGNKPELRDELAAHLESRDEDRMDA